LQLYLLRLWIQNELPLHSRHWKEYFPCSHFLRIYFGLSSVITNWI
jgi:hypothetical protein